MPNIEEHESDPKAAPKLASALKDLHKARMFVPPEVDETVLGTARQHLEHLPKRRPGWRPLLPWAALAASIVLVAWLVHTLTRPAAPAASFAMEDINRDGRVDILDAFALARQIESGGTLDARWDITGDGRINRADVDAIATRAVDLGGAAAADLKPPNDRRAEANGLEAACVVSDHHPTWQVRSLPMTPLTPSLSPNGGEGGRRSGEGAAPRDSWPQYSQRIRDVLSLTAWSRGPERGNNAAPKIFVEHPRTFVIEWPNRENGS